MTATFSLIVVVEIWKNMVIYEIKNHDKGDEDGKFYNL